MKYLLRNAKSICALVLAMVLCMPLSTVAFAVGNTTDTEDEISAVLAQINAEYGTDIHILTESELAKYGLTTAEPAAASRGWPGQSCKQNAVKQNNVPDK